MDAKQTATAQLAALTEAVANLGNHHRGTGRENAARQLSLALAKVISDGLMHYYMEKKDYENPEELYDDPFYSIGVFERVQTWEKANVIEMFREALRYDLESNELFCKVQEFFLGLHNEAGNKGSRGEAMYAFLPVKPVDDHITNSATFFALLR
jgi:hypothetical protein